MVTESDNTRLLIDIIGRYCDISPGSDLDHSVSDSDVTRLYELGLAPILHHCDTETPLSVSPASLALIKAADATAKVLYAQTTRALAKILDALAGQQIETIILKGAALGGDWYAAPHHRTMGDVDILLRRNQASHAFALLRDLGFESREHIPQKPSLDHHNLPVVTHPDLDVTTDFQIALFSRSGMMNDRLFFEDSLWNLTESTTVNNFPCRRFVPELQLFHVAAHWAIDNNWNSNVLGFVDFCRLATATNRPISWTFVSRLISENRYSGEIVCILLNELDSLGILDIPREVSGNVYKAMSRLGQLNWRATRQLIECYPLSLARRSPRHARRARQTWRRLIQPEPGVYRTCAALLTFVRGVFRLRLSHEPI